MNDMRQPPPPEQDSRGVLDLALLQQRINHQRFGVPTELDGLVDWVWSLSWDLPPAAAHWQRTVNHPSVHLYVGTAALDGVRSPPIAPHCRIEGVWRTTGRRWISASAWNVAVKWSVGGFGAVFDGSVAQLTDRDVSVCEALGLDEADVVDRISAPTSISDRATALIELVAEMVSAADPKRLRAAREVCAIAAVAEADRQLRTTSALASASGYSARTLQRMFLEYAGVTPGWVMRRYRLLEAAAEVQRGERVDWAQVASHLGYADQAHLIRDFSAAVGETPEAFARAARSVQAASARN